MKNTTKKIKYLLSILSLLIIPNVLFALDDNIYVSLNSYNKYNDIRADGDYETVGVYNSITKTELKSKVECDNLKGTIDQSTERYKFVTYYNTCTYNSVNDSCNSMGVYSSTFNMPTGCSKAFGRQVRCINNDNGNYYYPALTSSNIKLVSYDDKTNVCYCSSASSSSCSSTCSKYNSLNRSGLTSSSDWRRADTNIYYMCKYSEQKQSGTTQRQSVLYMSNGVHQFSDGQAYCLEPGYTFKNQNYIVQDKIEDLNKCEKSTDSNKYCGLAAIIQDGQINYGNDYETILIAMRLWMAAKFSSNGDDDFWDAEAGVTYKSTNVFRNTANYISSNPNWDGSTNPGKNIWYGSSNILKNAISLFRKAINGIDIIKPKFVKENEKYLGKNVVINNNYIGKEVYSYDIVDANNNPNLKITNISTDNDNIIVKSQGSCSGGKCSGVLVDTSNAKGATSFKFKITYENPNEVVSRAGYYLPSSGGNFQTMFLFESEVKPAIVDIEIELSPKCGTMTDKNGKIVYYDQDGYVTDKENFDKVCRCQSYLDHDINGRIYYDKDAQLVETEEDFYDSCSCQILGEEPNKRYLDKFGHETDAENYLNVCPNRCVHVEDKYYDDEGKEIEGSDKEKEFEDKCSCVILEDENGEFEYHDSNTNVVDIEEYKYSCSCKIFGEDNSKKYYDKDGMKIVDENAEEVYLSVCPHQCSQINGVYYDMDGKVTNEQEYLNSCACQVTYNEYGNEIYHDESGKIITSTNSEQDFKDKCACKQINNVLHDDSGYPTEDTDYYKSVCTNRCVRVRQSNGSIIYYTKDGSETTDRNTYLDSCACQEVDGKLYDTSGFEIESGDYQDLLNKCACQKLDNGKYLNISAEDKGYQDYVDSCGCHIINGVFYNKYGNPTDRNSYLISCGGEFTCPFYGVDYDVPDTCENDNEGTIKDPEMCSILKNDALKYDYETTTASGTIATKYNGVGTGSNGYCQVYCREEIKFTFMDKASALAGRTFTYDVPSKYDKESRKLSVVILSTKECTSIIDYDRWLTAYNQVNDAIIGAWNTLKDYEATYNHIREYVPTTETATCSASDCCYGHDETYDCGTEDEPDTCTSFVCDYSEEESASQNYTVWHWNEGGSGPFRYNYASVNSNYYNNYSCNQYRYYMNMYCNNNYSYYYRNSCNYYRDLVNSYCKNSNNVTINNQPANSTVRTSGSGSCSCWVCSKGHNCSVTPPSDSIVRTNYNSALSAYKTALENRDKLLYMLEDCNFMQETSPDLQTYKNKATYEQEDGYYGSGYYTTSQDSRYKTQAYLRNIGYLLDTYKQDDKSKDKIEIDYDENTRFDEGYSIGNNSYYDRTFASYIHNEIDSVTYGKSENTSNTIKDHCSSCAALTNMSSSMNTGEINYYYCYGSELNAYCENRKITVPTNNIVDVKINSESMHYQNTDFSSQILSGKIKMTNEVNYTNGYRELEKYVYPVSPYRQTGEYGIEVKYSNLGESSRVNKIDAGTYNCSYKVKNNLTNYDCNETPDHNCCPSASVCPDDEYNPNKTYLGVYFRSIDLNDVFPGSIYSPYQTGAFGTRKIGYNWTTSKAKQVINEIQTKGDDAVIENEATPKWMYKVTLNASNMKVIRDYNKTKVNEGVGYLDYSLNCDTSTYRCTSNFLRSNANPLYQSIDNINNLDGKYVYDWGTIEINTDVTGKVNDLHYYRAGDK